MFDGAAGWLELHFWVLCRDSTRDDVHGLNDRQRPVKVDLVCSDGVASVETADLRNRTKGETHCDLQLGRGEIHSTDKLRDRVLYLQTRVELQEEVGVLLRVEVLDRAGTDISDGFGELHGRLLHFAPDGRLRSENGSLFDNFLMASLDRAVSAKYGDRFPMLVSEELHLEVSARVRELHDKNRRARDLSDDL